MASPNKMHEYAGVRLLVFRVADLACAADASVVREILPAQQATRVPGAHEAVEGLINVRGRLVTLINGRQALNHPPENGDGPVILVEVGERTVGISVDAVLDMFSVAPDDLAERADLPGVDAQLVKAVGRRADMSFVLLDTDALLGPYLAA
ncbi:MAG: purine-binding chemotaxis protein CheW [Gemmatimonadota bacterium]|nr:MAG: purine-binding chemotaxis protein CheW [Gemmatimonadota bacterium]